MKCHLRLVIAAGALLATTVFLTPADARTQNSNQNSSSTPSQVDPGPPAGTPGSQTPQTSSPASQAPLPQTSQAPSPQTSQTPQVDPGPPAGTPGKHKPAGIPSNQNSDADPDLASARMKESKAAEKGKSMSLTGSFKEENGRTVFVNDKDKSSFDVVNPDAIKGHEGAHVKIKGKLNEADHSVSVEKVTMMRKDKQSEDGK
jgi:hypothetical protein